MVALISTTMPAWIKRLMENDVWTDPQSMRRCPLLVLPPKQRALRHHQVPQPQAQLCAELPLKPPFVLNPCPATARLRKEAGNWLERAGRSNSATGQFGTKGRPSVATTIGRLATALRMIPLIAAAVARVLLALVTAAPPSLNLFCRGSGTSQIG